VVERIVATSSGVKVVVRNQGQAPVSDEFWVDVYVDPDPAPTAVNQSWEGLASQGLVFGCRSNSLCARPGPVDRLTNSQVKKVKEMKCLKCHKGELQVDGVPAEICPVCGEAYLSDAVAQQIFDIVNPLLKVGQSIQEDTVLPAPSVDIRFPPLAPAHLKRAVAA